ncbi:MAG: PhzF family phenazine biosynthesis protein [Pseudomonadota bacterium]
MKTYSFRLLNVFAESTFGGNPLCVFENAADMQDEQMQALALQFNLSETCFILPSDKASARMRIFTTGHEMPFAGHPTLGTAHVVREVFDTGDRLSLECKAGVVAVEASGDHWTFTAPTPGGPKTMAPDLPAAQIAALLGLATDDLLGEPMWVDTGSDQLLIAVRNDDAVRRVRPDSAFLADWPPSRLGRRTAYVFAVENDTAVQGQQIQVRARYFFASQGGGIAEDPGTGSACANLGGWWIAAGRKLPARFSVAQGEQVLRPCRLSLQVTEDQQIRVGGRVMEIGRGTVSI